MTGTPDTTSAGQQTADHIQREVAEILSIYTRLYPTQALSFIFYQGKDPVWGAPHVIEGPITFSPGHLNAEYLGRIHRPGAHPAVPEITVTVSIPRKPLKGEIRQTEAPWTPVRPLRALYPLSPLLYEQIRYLAEMARKRRAALRHDKISLPLGDGSGLFPATPEPGTDQRPAILVGMHWLEVGGAEKLAFDTVHWALEAGLRVIVVAGVASLQRLADKLPDHPDVSFIRLDRYLPYHLWPRYIEKLVLAENIRLIHIHHCRQLYDALPHLRATTPWVKVIDSTHIVEYADGGYPRTSGVWSNFIDTHHVISGELTDYYRDNFHVLGKVRLGRMLDRHDDSRSLPGVTMQPGQKTLRVAFIGRLYYQKRPVVVAEAFRALSVWARNNGVELTGSIVGEGPFLEAIRKLLQRRGLADSVSLLPANSDVPALLRTADILLLPSNNEGLALVCYEAIEQGCIPVSTDVGSQDEVVPAELLVPLAPRKSVQGIVTAVDNLWRDAGFMARQQAEMQRLWQRISSDPTAKEVLMPLYRAAAQAAGAQDIAQKDVQE